jgi:Na+-transporting NADH:ubiquinone oxidoreductase subunit NqrA
MCMPMLPNGPFCDAHKDVITHAVRGRYPADDPGVLLFHVRQSPAENKAWFINGQDLLLMAQLLQTGRYPTALICRCRNRCG